ncbi:hypothetical protein ACN47E_007273 [Coniothyrium glycines]
MATSPSARPIYHDPKPTGARRNSGRKSFTSPLSRSSSDLNSPRASCPKDGDAFSYNPVHLKGWYLDDSMWIRLPAELQSSLSDVQHSGAAVLTGFERLDNHTKGLEAIRADCRASVDELIVGLDDLPPPKFRTISNASSVLQSDISSPPSAGSSNTQSGCTSPVASYFQLPQPMSPASPMSLSESDILGKRSIPRDRSFSIPQEPADAYYDTELSHLRTEALPRLRHKCHKVDTDWYEAKRSGLLGQDDVNAFENWWAEKKCKVLELGEYGKRLADERGLAPTGLGWCAP